MSNSTIQCCKCKKSLNPDTSLYTTCKCGYSFCFDGDCGPTCVCDLLEAGEKAGLTPAMITECIQAWATA
jgi:hypothetical protein